MIEAAPYVTTVEDLDKSDCAFCVHGGQSPAGSSRSFGVRGHLGHVRLGVSLYSDVWVMCVEINLLLVHLGCRRLGDIYTVGRPSSFYH